MPAAIIHFKDKRWIGHIASLLSLMVTVLLTLVLGISIPEFTVDSTNIPHLSQIDFEFTSEAILRFKTLPSNNTFRYLDSLCALHTPATVDTPVTGSPQPVKTFWSKENNAYHFSINDNTEDKNCTVKMPSFPSPSRRTRALWS